MPAPEGHVFRASLAVKRFRIIRPAFCGDLELRGRLNEPVDDELLAILRRILLGLVEFPGLRLSAEDFEKDVDTKLESNFQTVEDRTPDIKREQGGVVGCMRPFDELLLWYYGKPFSFENQLELCWRLASGWSLLMSGRHLKKELVGAPIWLTLRIEDFQYGKPAKTGAPQLRVLLRILGGPYAGLGFAQTSTHKFLVGRLAKNIGFPLYKRAHFKELAGTCFLGLADFSEPGRPRWTEFDASSGVVSFNRQLRKIRRAPCDWEVRQYSVPCHFCIEGWLGCPRGSHTVTYIRQPCSHCTNDGWFDPRFAAPVCLECQAKAFRKGLVLEKWL